MLGNGSPDGLKEDQSRLRADFLALADALDAMTSHRTNRERSS